MTNLDRELIQLKKDISILMKLVYSQLESAETSYAEQDVALAQQVHQLENRVNSLDMSLDKDCENIIALYNPVAGDLRFVLATMKTVAHLERIGDHADKIARYVRKKKLDAPTNKKLLARVKLYEMFDLALEMIKLATSAFVEEDSDIATKVFAKDLEMNELYNNATGEIDKYAQEKDISIESLLYLFSILNKLERIGDLAKNIAEETIFSAEAKIIRHEKTKDKAKGIEHLPDHDDDEP